MDYKKIIQDLMRRAENTTFENEREICLAKIAELTAKYFPNSSEEVRKETFDPLKYINIKNLREIFTQSFFPYFSKDFSPNPSQIPYPLKFMDTFTVLNRMEESLMHVDNFSEESEAITNFLIQLIKKEKEKMRLNPLAKINTWQWYFFTLLPTSMVVYLQDGEENPQEFIRGVLHAFEESKENYWKNIGKYDDLILKVINPLRISDGKTAIV